MYSGAERRYLKKDAQTSISAIEEYDLKQSGGAGAWFPPLAESRAGCLVSENARRANRVSNYISIIAITSTMEYTIDAAEKILGRLATEVAVLLRGKNDPSFLREKFSDNHVTVFNIDKISFTGRKAKQKLYQHHSGFHGGLKTETLESVMRRDSRVALRHAVMGMLPKNKLRARWIKNLTLVKGGK